MKLKKELESGSIGLLDAREAEKRDGKGIDNVSRYSLGYSLAMDNYIPIFFCS
jgi:hypothetical protein